MTASEGAEAASGSTLARGEAEDFVRAYEERRRQIPRAVVVGVLSGLVAVAFNRTLLLASDARDRLVAWAHTLGWSGFGVPVALGLVGGAVAVWLVRRFAPEASGSGIPQLEAVVHHLRAMRAVRVLIVKFVGGVVGIGSGLTLGREGPTVQMGGAVGQIVSRWFRCGPLERRTLISAGAGAGLAAAFNAPLSGLVFVLEELQRDFAPTVFTVTLLAAALSDVVTRMLQGQMPVFHVGTHGVPPLPALPASLVLGILAGLLGVAFNRGLLGTLDFFNRVAPKPAWASGAMAGTVVGLVGWFVPEALGGGHPLVERALGGESTLAQLAAYFPLRFVLVMLSYGCGAPGGIFAPLLVLGAQLGLAVGILGHRVLPLDGHPETFAVVGMAAYFTAIVRAPLTGIVLMVEMTGDYSLVMPLLVACLTAAGVADALGDSPVYEALLERDLARSQETPELERTLLLQVTVQSGAPFAGRRVRDLGLPPGCVLVTIRRRREEQVATADTVLEVGDQLTVVVAPQAADAVPLLQRGVGAVT